MSVSTTVRRSSRRLALTLAAVASVTGAAVFAAAPSTAGTGTAGSASSPAASSLPADCNAQFQEATADGTLSTVTRVYGGLSRSATYEMPDYGNGPEQPKAMAQVNTTRGPVLISVRDNGTLWSHKAHGTGKPVQVGKGWGAIRQMTGFSNGTVYALTTYGGLVRYSVQLSLAGNAVVNSSGVVSGRGWNGIAFLTAVETTRQAEVLMGVSTSSGELMEYWVNLGGLDARGYALRPSWGGMKHLSVGGCRTSGARAILGVHQNGNVYSYVDRVNDRSGADIQGYGVLSEGFAAPTSLYSD